MVANAGGDHLAEEGKAGQHPVEFTDDSVTPGVWRYAKVERASVIVDGEDYFALMQKAMLNAQKRIMLVGWDFDTRIHLTLGRRWFQRIFRRKYPRRLGSFLMWLARHRKGLDIRVLKWSLGVFQFFSRGYMLVDIMRMAAYKQITFKFDTHHPVACSHHQKLAVLDDRLAVCGGIDMTQERWDTREHIEDDRRRRRPRGLRYDPWHDATMMMEGEVALHLAALSRERWHRAGGEKIDPVPPSDASLWPDGLDVQFENVEVGIARTRAEYDDMPQICEIENLVLAQIAAARKFVYIENQYLTSRKIADAIAQRLKEVDPPEFVIVHPITAEGWLEQQAMDHARNCIAQSLHEIDHADRFGLFVAYTGETPIYVHAKLMIIDDRILRIGSANLNNRSMGLDSECDVFIDCERPGNGHACEAIGKLRYSLLGEHTGRDPEEVARILAEDPSMLSFIEKHGKGDKRSLRRFEIPEMNDIEETLADSQMLDPERPDDMFEPFADGGLFRKGSRLSRAYNAAKRRLKK